MVHDIVRSQEPGAREPGAGDDIQTRGNDETTVMIHHGPSNDQSLQIRIEKRIVSLPAGLVGLAGFLSHGVALFTVFVNITHLQ